MDLKNDDNLKLLYDTVDNDQYHMITLENLRNCNIKYGFSLHSFDFTLFRLKLIRI